MFSRQQLDGDVLLREKGSHSPLIRGRVFDIAAEGISLVIETPLSANTPVELVVRVHDPAGQFLLHGQVAWCRQEQESEAYRLGIALEGAETTDDWCDWRALFID